MNRCPQNNFYVIATWYPQDPLRYQQWNLPGGSYLQTIELTKKISKKGYNGLGPPDSISIETVIKTTTYSIYKELML